MMDIRCDQGVGLPLGLWKDISGNCVHVTHVAKTLDGDIFVMGHLVNDESPSRNWLYPVAEFLETFVLCTLEDDITEQKKVRESK